MPEVSEDATILLAISWQALGRAKNGDERTILCNCTVVIVFAAFYIEANLNHIIRTMNKTKEMKTFLKNKHPGIQDKLAWFYNCFVAWSFASDKKQLYAKGIKQKLRKKFPGLNRIYKFRNDISHGKIDRSIANSVDTEKIRNQTKEIVDELFKIATKAGGHEIPRTITYMEAISDGKATP